MLAIGVDDEAVVARARAHARAGAPAARRRSSAGSSGRVARHAEVGQVDRRRVRVPWPSLVLRQSCRRFQAAARWRPRSITCELVGVDVQPRPDLAVGPLARGPPRRSALAEPEVDPAELAAGVPAADGQLPPLRRGRRPATSIQAPMASRFGPACVEPDGDPVAHRRRAARRRPTPTLRQSSTRLAVVDLDEVEQAVEVEVGERGAAAAVEARRSRRSAPASANVPSGWPSSRLLGSRMRVVGLRARRCPWRRTGRRSRRC